MIHTHTHTHAGTSEVCLIKLPVSVRFFVDFGSVSERTVCSGASGDLLYFTEYNCWKGYPNSLF